MKVCGICSFNISDITRHIICYFNPKSQRVFLSCQASCFKYLNINTLGLGNLKLYFKQHQHFNLRRIVGSPFTSNLWENNPT